mgnify:CR=1 FL=1
METRETYKEQAQARINELSAKREAQYLAPRRVVFLRFKMALFLLFFFSLTFIVSLQDKTRFMRIIAPPGYWRSKLYK